MSTTSLFHSVPQEVRKMQISELKKYGVLGVSYDKLSSLGFKTLEDILLRQCPYGKDHYHMNYKVQVALLKISRENGFNFNLCAGMFYRIALASLPTNFLETSIESLHLPVLKARCKELGFKTYEDLLTCKLETFMLKGKIGPERINDLNQDITSKFRTIDPETGDHEILWLGMFAK